MGKSYQSSKTIFWVNSHDSLWDDSLKNNFPLMRVVEEKIKTANHESSNLQNVSQGCSCKYHKWKVPGW